MQVPGRCVHVDCILESNHWNVGYLVVLVPYMNCTTSTEYSITYYMNVLCTTCSTYIHSYAGCSIRVHYMT